MSERWPFNAIKEVVVDGQKMIRIPKIYVRNTVLPSSSKYAGERQWSISDRKVDNSWHIHPAFMHNGKECRYIDIAKYYASKGKDGKACSIESKDVWDQIFDNTHHRLIVLAHTAGESRNVKNGTADQQGWHAYNIYEHHLLARLMLIEYGTSHIRKAIEGKERPFWKQDDSPSYHGIMHVWGEAGHSLWLDGFYTCWIGDGHLYPSRDTANFFAIYMFDNKGMQKYEKVEEYAVVSENGYLGYGVTNPIQGSPSYTSVDAGDVFIQDVKQDLYDGRRGSSSVPQPIDFCDVQWFNLFGDVMYHNPTYYGTPHFNIFDGRISTDGPFCLGPAGNTFRLAHYVE